MMILYLRYLIHYYHYVYLNLLFGHKHYCKQVQQYTECSQTNNRDYHQTQSNYRRVDIKTFCKSAANPGYFSVGPRPIKFLQNILLMFLIYLIFYISDVFTLQTKNVSVAKIRLFHTITKRLSAYTLYLLYILLYTNINKGIEAITHINNISDAKTISFNPTNVLIQYGNEYTIHIIPLALL